MPFHCSLLPTICCGLAMSITAEAAEVSPAAVASPTEQADLAVAVQANNDFAMALYRQLSADDPSGDLFFSPASISMALGMLAEGARGRTGVEMAQALAYPQSVVDQLAAGDPEHMALLPVHGGMRSLRSLLLPTDTSPQRAELAALRKQLAAEQAALKKALEAKRRAEADALRTELQTAVGDAPDRAGQDEQDDDQAHAAAITRYYEIASRANALADRVNTLASKVDPFQLHVANAIWIDKTFPVARPYAERITKFYGTGGVRAVDFGGHPEAQRLQINEWIAAQTQDHIRDLLAPGLVTNRTRMILANAIYFNGAWLHPFAAGASRRGTFTAADGNPTTVTLMHERGLGVAHFGAFQADATPVAMPDLLPVDEQIDLADLYPADDGFMIAELPYKGDALSMVVVLPMRHDGLPALEETLSSTQLNTCLRQLTRRTIDYKMPRFRTEATCTLRETLQAMGVRAAFAENIADLSHMHTGGRSAENLFVSDLIHKATLEVNEEGTKAVAVTVDVLEPSCALEMVPFIPEMHVNRPFMLLIRHRPTGAILFMGRVNSPQERKQP